MCRKWIIRDGIVTVQGDKENLTCLEKICRLDGKMRKYYEMIQQALDEFTKNLIVDDYEKGHEYNEGDYCLYDDTLWLCIESHTASDFDPSKWAKMTITNVLKILADNLKTTIQTCGILTDSLTTTILTVNSLVGTVGSQGGSITSLDGRVTALENAPAADSKTVIYDASMASVPGEGYYELTLSNTKTWGDVYTDFITNKKTVVVRVYFASIDTYYDLYVNRCGVNSGIAYTIYMSGYGGTDTTRVQYLFNNDINLVMKSSSTVYIYTKFISFDT